MKTHGNAPDNPADHHLYAIVDVERQNVFKYGISGKPLNPDGTSPRALEQVSLFNRVVGMIRFFSRVLLMNIPGRKRAEEIEQQYIDAFKTQHGRNPSGNL